MTREHGTTRSLSMNLGLLRCLLLPSLLMVSQAYAQQSLDGIIARELPALLDIYKTLHAAPELSHLEEKTATLLARELRSAGFIVTERVGKYARSEWTGYGVVAVMTNGEGPTILVRSDLDALPIEERTNLPYASQVKTADGSSTRSDRTLCTTTPC
jgi:hypothetical protein